MIYPLSIIVTYIWIGFVCAISFMESWLKFRAESVTTTIGLDIGKIIFGALNKMEWIFFAIILTELIIKKFPLINMRIMFLLIPVAVLILQSYWLLPVLDERADLLIGGQTPATSHVHFIYVGVEVIKIISLFIFGYFLMKEKI